MTSANTEDGSSALPFIFLSFVLQFGALIAFTLIALGSFLAVAFSLKMEQFSSPGRHQNEYHVHMVGVSNCRGCIHSHHLPKNSVFTTGAKC